jgi:hypothetical protein
MLNTRVPIILSFTLAAASASIALAYPEFQGCAEKESGRSVNCAMCHTNPDGPVGQGEGQVGGLTAKELERLNEARAAIEPGKEVDSPILNEFGDSIIKTIGKAKFVELRKDPQKLAEVLDRNSDLDEDGIADGTEFKDGTDPLNKLHGDPYKLLIANLVRYRFDLTLAAVGTVTVVFGLLKLVRSLQAVTKEH